MSGSVEPTEGGRVNGVRALRAALQAALDMAKHHGLPDTAKAIELAEAELLYEAAAEVIMDQRPPEDPGLVEAPRSTGS